MPSRIVESKVISISPDSPQHNAPEQGQILAYLLSEEQGIFSLKILKGAVTGGLMGDWKGKLKFQSSYFYKVDDIS